MSNFLFAQRLRQIRAFRGMSQTELAFLIGSSQCAISEYELGKQVPGARVLMNLAKALNTTSDYLLGLKGDM